MNKEDIKQQILTLAKDYADCLEAEKATTEKNISRLLVKISDTKSL